jgi:hypothetical protein
VKDWLLSRRDFLKTSALAILTPYLPRRRKLRSRPVGLLLLLSQR